jgi:nitrogenase molybdenum-iron protein alpha/beta subunit
MTFSIQADPSLALPIACWLYEYLGMFPVSVETPPGRETAFRQPLQEWLSAIGCPEAWQLPWHNADPDLLFADGQQVALTKATERRGGVEIMLPSRACLDIVPKAMLGATGGAWLVEQILRELWWVLWL